MRRGAVCSRRGDPLRSGYRPDRAARQFLVRSGLRRARLPDPLPLCAARGRRRERRRGPGRALRRDRRVAARRMALAAPGNQIHGRARAIGGGSSLFFLGTDLDAAQARRSWELVHELVHLGFPSLPRRHHWAEERLATYVEPIVRARAGELSAEKVWGNLVRGLPQGLPGRGDEGLDRTLTWGRTYWGGALFWLLADVEIRERPGNRLGLEDALRPLVAQGGSIAERWPLQRALEVGDRAVGTRVLEVAEPDIFIFLLRRLAGFLK